MIIQVTGSRTWGHDPDASTLIVRNNYLNYDDWEKVAIQLNNAQTKFGKDLLVVEGHADGLDIMVYALCIQENIAVVAMPANWGLHGKAAGPIRNQRMIDGFAIGCALAFSHDLKSSKGTADMVRRLKKANIPTKIIT